MSSLFTIAYFLALLNWLPISILSSGAPTEFKRGPLRLLYGLSIVLALYEAYMSLLWSPAVVAPIRIDVFILMLPYGLLYLIYGIAYSIYAKNSALSVESKWRSKLIAAWCLAVPLLAIAGYASISHESKQSSMQFDLGRRFRYEARLRDDQVQARFFGPITETGGTIAGHYVADGNDSRFAKIVINDALDVWLWSTELYEHQGRLKHLGGDAYEWQNQSKDVTPLSGKINVIDREHFAFSGDVGPNPSPQTTQFTKVAAPRFPLEKNATDAVEFLGVFSTTFDDTGKDLGVYQMWLWRSKNKIWGQHYRHHATRGSTIEFLAPTKIEPYCMGSCDRYDLRFQLERSNYRLQRVSADSWSVRDNDNPSGPSYVLRRGQILPGYVYDLAPLHSAEETQQWIAAVGAGHFVKWKVPEKIEISELSQQ
ncbi:hypothetical protein RF679_16310 [Undibacterium cyanobacteriorum]|uniref:Uncharacterized protein n=1 Tax=Undibacterium cyanobacteriorum TaxID=3073561 RepID=A0ABY9RG39_9BURK|nr:hypothetical protein [Undibacterium sp. 20NA77.5]WMW80197.1 hypothetical protein RF679_16310 [Undibacterium sp. 20NA77.5]